MWKNDDVCFAGLPLLRNGANQSHGLCIVKTPFLPILSAEIAKAQCREQTAIPVFDFTLS